MANIDRVATFHGRNGEGGINVAAVVAGEQVISVYSTTSPGADMSTNFGKFIPQNGKVYQSSASDLSAETYIALIASAAI
jgi:hypothetical protein